MQIKNMFEKKIDRDIKGVIKVGQSDEENVYQELDEYVVTKELLKHAEHITSRSININAVSVWIVFCKYCSHRIESPYHSISHLLQKSEAFQSVHHVTFILCYTVL